MTKPHIPSIGLKLPEDESIRPLILGCDPGFSGAIAIYDHKQDKLIDVIDMPIREYKGNTALDPNAIHEFVKKYNNKIHLSVIEEVGVMTGKEGRVSMFKFGEGFGIVKGILAANNIPIFQVKPAIWKSLENLNSDKSTSLVKARKYFPDNFNNFFDRKKDNGRAEAAILSRFGSRFLNLV